MSDFHLKIFWPLRVTKWLVFDEFWRFFFSKWTIFGGESKFCLIEVRNWSGPPKKSMCMSDSSQWFSVKDLLNVHEWLIWVILSWKLAPCVWGTHLKDFQWSRDLPGNRTRVAGSGTQCAIHYATRPVDKEGTWYLKSYFKYISAKWVLK